MPSGACALSSASSTSPLRAILSSMPLNGGSFATALAGAVVLFPQVAFAQDTTSGQTSVATEDEEEENRRDEEIVVTGSRIRSANLESNVPIASITVEDVFAQGQTSIGDTLNDLSLFQTGLQGVVVANREPLLAQAAQGLPHLHWSDYEGAAGVLDALRRIH